MNDVMLPKPVETQKSMKKLPLINADDTDLQKPKTLTADQHGLTRIKRRMSDWPLTH
jgi:hypothetical protein